MAGDHQPAAAQCLADHRDRGGGGARRGWPGLPRLHRPHDGGHELLREQQVRPLARVVWSTMRPPVVLLLVLYAACGAAAGGAAGTAALGSALLVVLPFLAYSAVVNDLADEHIDRVNLPEDARRVLAAGAAHRRQLWAVALGAGALTVAAAAWLGALALAVAGTGLLVSTAYSLGPVRLATRGVIAPLVLPACYVAVPVPPGAARVGRWGARLRPAAARGPLRRLHRPHHPQGLPRPARRRAVRQADLPRPARARLTCHVSATCWAAGAGLLLWARPGGSPAYVLATLAGTALAMTLLHELAGPRARHRQQDWLISALAIVGRGLVLVLAVDLAAPAAGWPSALTSAVIAALAVSVGGQALRIAASRAQPRSPPGCGAPPGPVARRLSPHACPRGRWWRGGREPAPRHTGCALTANTPGSGDFRRRRGR